MKKLFFLLLVAITPLALTAQTTYSSEQIKEISDSILIEGNLLYRFERAAWISTDLAHANKSISKQFKTYFVYRNDQDIVTIIMNKEDKVAATYTFNNGSSEEYDTDLSLRNLTDNEAFLLAARDSILNNITKGKYPISCPSGYSLNLILFPYENGFKYYFITGTSQNGVIPFGNDYIFFAGKDYSIQSWRKFHSRLIPVQQMNGKGELTSTSHSHLKTEPFISATDICTFKLYAGYVGLKSFQVYSPALSLWFRYSIDSDTIETSEDMFE